MEELKYLAARIALGNADPEEIQSTVHELLAQGVYSDHFLAIIEAEPATRAEVVPPFCDYLEQEQVPIPDKDRAVWHIIAYHTRRIAAAEVDPLVGLDKLIADVYRPYDFVRMTRKFLGDSHGIEELIGLYWDYDDLKDEAPGRKPKKEDTERFRKRVLDCCRKWAERFADQAR